MKLVERIEEMRANLKVPASTLCERADVAPTRFYKARRGTVELTANEEELLVAALEAFAFDRCSLVERMIQLEQAVAA